MRRTKKQSLRLFVLGNDRCPICLRAFTKQAVEEGDTEAEALRRVVDKVLAETRDDVDAASGPPAE